MLTLLSSPALKTTTLVSRPKTRVEGGEKGERGVVDELKSGRSDEREKGRRTATPSGLRRGRGHVESATRRGSGYGEVWRGAKERVKGEVELQLLRKECEYSEL